MIAGASCTVAVFDLDGTVADGDLYIAFLAHVLRRHPARFARCSKLPAAVVRHRLGLLPNDALKTAFLTAVLGGMRRATVSGLAASFASRAVRVMKPAAQQRIAWHRARGDWTILATASLDLYAEPLGRALGLDQVVSTLADWNGERLSGRLRGPNLRGQAKVAALQSLACLSAPRPFIIAYSDHHSDMDLLRFADRGVAIDPTRELHALATAQGMAVERWRTQR